MNFFGLSGIPFLNDANMFLQKNIFDPMQGGIGDINQAIAGPQVSQMYNAPIGPMQNGMPMPSQSLPNPVALGNKDTLGITQAIGGGMAGGLLSGLGQLLGGQQPEQQQQAPMAPAMPQQAPRMQPVVPNQSQSMVNQRPTLRGLLRG